MPRSPLGPFVEITRKRGTADWVDVTLEARWEDGGRASVVVRLVPDEPTLEELEEALIRAVRRHDLPALRSGICSIRLMEAAQALRERWEKTPRDVERSE
jgi:hypothetical protein